MHCCFLVTKAIFKISVLDLPQIISTLTGHNIRYNNCPLNPALYKEDWVQFKPEVFPEVLVELYVGFGACCLQWCWTQLHCIAKVVLYYVSLWSSASLCSTVVSLCGKFVLLCNLCVSFHPFATTDRCLYLLWSQCLFGTILHALVLFFIVLVCCFILAILHLFVVVLCLCLFILFPFVILLQSQMLFSIVSRVFFFQTEKKSCL